MSAFGEATSLDCHAYEVAVLPALMAVEFEIDGQHQVSVVKLQTFQRVQSSRQERAVLPDMLRIGIQCIGPMLHDFRVAHGAVRIECPQGS
jgi:hypothetical protein